MGHFSETDVVFLGKTADLVLLFGQKFKKEVKKFQHSLRYLKLFFNFFISLHVSFDDIIKGSDVFVLKS